jgi:hypothetical protein
MHGDDLAHLLIREADLPAEFHVRPPVSSSEIPHILNVKLERLSDVLLSRQSH